MSSPSPVIDAFTAGAAAEDADRAEPLHREAEATVSPYSEIDLARRAITAASRTSSKAVKESPRKSLISTGEDAHIELEQFHPVSDDKRVLAVLGQLRETLELAVEELGPIPGGRLGSVKAPGQAPRSVSGDHQPTPEMMAELAHRAGAVVGRAGALGVVDSVAELRGVMCGCPDCASPVADKQAASQEISPEKSSVIEYGLCELGHRLEREKGSALWQPTPAGALWASG
jgi:hypothetical protein